MTPMMMGGPGGPRGGRPGFGGPGGPGGPGRKPTRENPNSVQISSENAKFMMKNGFLYMQQHHPIDRKFLGFLRILS